ncbi:HET-domain-containing protein [Mytilinidion resinicola]|uniref:HET-domain-containing protein n=1 Tax=Mytilinidion resinicola TaxID=574789 RepID=A0A6A6YKP8_9PEZI|nr:HET-domain-containing protein [Mytilinidion resinicola]KAF2809391.1 HET-domain-containing protein [Mytilinidion resinicola]
MLCNACLEILRIVRRPGVYESIPHQPSVDALCASALGGCQICWQLRNILKHSATSANYISALNLGDHVTVCSSDTSSARTKHAFDLSFNVRRSESVIFNLEVYTVSDYVPETSTNSASSWALIERWTANCILEHPKCKQSGQATWVPTRLLDLGLPDSNTNPRLIISTSALEGIPYATLSHCWGKSAILRLLASNLKDLCDEIPLQTLPKTFRDAIAVTKRAGIRYLWIDSLAIIQNSAADWKREAALMGKVYKYSRVNIAATGAVDSTEGCFFTRDPRLIPPSQVTIKWDDWDGIIEETYTVLPGQKIWQTQLNDVPLSRRAWFLQERLLSPRVVHFTKTQIFWECHTMSACESFPIALPKTLRHNRVNQLKSLALGATASAILPETLSKVVNGEFIGKFKMVKPLYAHWNSLVELYSLGGLTVLRDKLPALSGVADEMRHLLLEEDYAAGLWRKSLPRSLLWIPKIHPGENKCYRPREYRAPSWSWASIEGPVSFAWCSKTVFPSQSYGLVAVLRVYVDITKGRETGEVSGGYVRMNVPVVDATWDLQAETGVSGLTTVTIRDRVGRNRQFLLPESSGEDALLFDEDIVQRPPPRELALAALFYTTDHQQVEGKVATANNSCPYGLVLESTESGKYRRIGVFLSSQDRLQRAFRKLTPRWVTII